MFEMKYLIIVNPMTRFSWTKKNKKSRRIALAFDVVLKTTGHAANMKNPLQILIACN